MDRQIDRQIDRYIDRQIDNGGGRQIKRMDIWRYIDMVEGDRLRYISRGIVKDNRKQIERQKGQVR